MIALSTVLGAVKLAGSHLPAFKALFDATLSTFSEKDQATLQDAYKAQMAKSDNAHQRVQDM